MKRTRKKMLSYFLVLLMVCTAFAFEPIPARAATTYTVSTEAELTTALDNAVDGDVIVVENISPEGWSMNLSITKQIVITKDITLDVRSTIDYVRTYDYEQNPTEPIDVLPESLVLIRDCKVKIIGYSGFTAPSNEVFTFKVEDENKDTALTIDSTAWCYGGISIVDNPDNGVTSAVTIEQGTYDIPQNRTSAFVINGGSLIVNGGSFKEELSDEYIGENSELVYIYDSYQIRSTIFSEEFASFLTDGKVIVHAVAPEDEAIDGMTYVQAELSPLVTGANSVFANYISDGLYDISYNNDVTGESENHLVEVEFQGSVNSSIQTEADNVVANMPIKADKWGTDLHQFTVRDMEVVNMWVNGFDYNDAAFYLNTINYSGELKEYLKNANIDLRVVMCGAGIDSPLYVLSAGDAVVSYNGIVCGKTQYPVAASVNHIIYVPDGTATDANSLKTAAQKRINEYLGSDSKVVVSYGGAFNTLSDPEGYTTDADYQAEMLENLGLTTAPEHYFVATSGNKQYKFLIIPDSSKMIIPTYKTMDTISNVTITSVSPEIPLDTSIRATELTSGTTYENIIDTLGVEENVTFDLKLYSASTVDYISSLDNDVFEVSIPIPETFKDKTLMAYYVGDDGKITKYPAEVVKVGDEYYAIFETDHFSIYTIAEGVADVCDVNGTSHKLTAVPAKAATTTAEGNKAYWTCDCGKWFADADGKTEITDKTSVVIPKLKDTTVTTTEDTTEDVADGSPATGDNTNIVLLFGMMLISMAAIFAKKKAD